MTWGLGDDHAVEGVAGDIGCIGKVGDVGGALHIVDVQHIRPGHVVTECLGVDPLTDLQHPAGDERGLPFEEVLDVVAVDGSTPIVAVSPADRFEPPQVTEVHPPTRGRCLSRIQVLRARS